MPVKEYCGIETSVEVIADGDKPANLFTVNSDLTTTDNPTSTLAPEGQFIVYKTLI